MRVPNRRFQASGDSRTSTDSRGRESVLGECQSLSSGSGFICSRCNVTNGRSRVPTTQELIPRRKAANDLIASVSTAVFASPWCHWSCWSIPYLLFLDQGMIEEGRGDWITVTSIRSESSGVQYASASRAGLSQRIRLIRGKRSATPERWRELTLTLSKATSKTSSLATSRTGPYRLTV